MEIKNQELQGILQSLKSIKRIKDWKTKMTIVRNIKVIENEIAVHEEMAKPSDEYNEFEKKRFDLIKEYSKKDEKGRPIQKFDKDTGRPYFDVPKEVEDELNSKILDLADSDEYKKVVEDHNDAMKSYADFMKEPIGIELFSIKEKDLSTAEIDEYSLLAIYPIIELDEEVPVVKMEVKKPVSKKRTSVKKTTGKGK